MPGIIGTPAESGPLRAPGIFHRRRAPPQPRAWPRTARRRRRHVDEQRVGGQPERLRAMRLEFKRPPDPPACSQSHPSARCWTSTGRCATWAATNGRVGRGGLQRRDNRPAHSNRSRPARRRIISPSRRSSTNRVRPLPTVGCDTRSRATTAVLLNPSAQPSTIRAGNASACADLRHRAHLRNCSRSSSLNTNAAFGHPERDIPHSATYSMVNDARHRHGALCTESPSRLTPPTPGSTVDAAVPGTRGCPIGHFHGRSR